MPRLIDADALIKKFEEAARYGQAHGMAEEVFLFGAFINQLKNENVAPTIEAKSVKHGRWVDRHGGKYVNPKYECSECRKEAPYRPKLDDLHNWYHEQDLSDYCPNCGAKMDGGAAHER